MASSVLDLGEKDEPHFVQMFVRPTCAVLIRHSARVASTFTIIFYGLTRQRLRPVVAPSYNMPLLLAIINPNRRQAAIAAYSYPFKLAYNPMTLAAFIDIGIPLFPKIDVIG